MENDSKDAIIKLLQKVDDAWNTGDPSTMASYWSENGLNVTPTGDVFEGRAAIETDLAASIQGFLKGSKHRLTVSSVYEVTPDVVVADGEAEISNVFGPDGTALGPWISQFSVVCTKKDDNAWQINQMRAYTFLPKH